MFADPVFHELADQRSCTNDGSSRLLSLASMRWHWPPTSRARDVLRGVRTELHSASLRSRGVNAWRVSFSTRRPRQLLCFEAQPIETKPGAAARYEWHSCCHSRWHGEDNESSRGS